MVAAQDIIDLTTETLLLAATLAAPILAAALAAAVLTALLQALTRISDATLSALPRLVLTVVALVAAAPWIGHRAASFAERAWGLIQAVQL